LGKNNLKNGLVKQVGSDLCTAITRFSTSRKGSFIFFKGARVYLATDKREGRCLEGGGAGRPTKAFRKLDGGGKKQDMPWTMRFALSQGDRTQPEQRPRGLENGERGRGGVGRSSRAEFYISSSGYKITKYSQQTKRGEGGEIKKRLVANLKKPRKRETKAKNRVH